MTLTEPTRADGAPTREQEILAEALAVRCPDCGTSPEVWCFRAGGRWTLHGRRILERAALAAPSPGTEGAEA